MENEVKSFRDRIQIEKESQSQINKLSYRSEMNEKITKKSEHEIARLGIRIEEKDRYIEKLKKDFDRVFEELKKYKKEAERATKYEAASPTKLYSSVLGGGGGGGVGNSNTGP